MVTIDMVDLIKRLSNRFTSDLLKSLTLGSWRKAGHKAASEAGPAPDGRRPFGSVRRRRDPGGPQGVRGREGKEAQPKGSRSRSSQAPAGRAHQRLDEEHAQDRHPQRQEGLQLPRLPAPGDDRDPGQVILRRSPDTRLRQGAAYAEAVTVVPQLETHREQAEPRRTRGSARANVLRRKHPGGAPRSGSGAQARCRRSQGSCSRTIPSRTRSSWCRRSRRRISFGSGRC